MCRILEEKGLKKGCGSYSMLTRIYGSSIFYTVLLVQKYSEPGFFGWLDGLERDGKLF